MEYRVHFELSSKVNVVTIIMLHNIAHTKVYDSTPDAGIRTTANTTRTNSIDFALCPILKLPTPVGVLNLEKSIL
jgi:hypothetical protein